MRSAPARSFRRHSGLRMMVLAVNERRSPAESTNGNSALAPGRGLVASESSSSKSSGIASWIRRFGVFDAREALLPLVDREHHRALAARAARRRARPRPRPARPRSPRAQRLRLTLRRDLAQRPDAGALGQALGQQIADRAEEHAPARHRAARVRAEQLEELRAEGGAALAARPRAAPRRRRAAARRAPRPAARAARPPRTARAAAAAARGAGGSSCAGTRS